MNGGPDTSEDRQEAAFHDRNDRADRLGCRIRRPGHGDKCVGSGHGAAHKMSGQGDASKSWYEGAEYEGEQHIATLEALAGIARKDIEGGNFFQSVVQLQRGGHKDYRMRPFIRDINTLMQSDMLCARGHTPNTHISGILIIQIQERQDERCVCNQHV